MPAHKKIEPVSQTPTQTGTPVDQGGTATEQPKSTDMSNPAENTSTAPSSALRVGPAAAMEMTPVATSSSVPGTIDAVSASDAVSMVSEESSTTKWVVIVVVLVLLIIAVAGGAFYYLTQYKYAPSGEILSPQPEVSPAPSGASDTQMQDSEPVSQSDEVGDISKDLNNTNLENLDSGLDEIQKQLP